MADIDLKYIEKDREFIVSKIRSEVRNLNELICKATSLGLTMDVMLDTDSGRYKYRVSDLVEGKEEIVAFTFWNTTRKDY